MAFNQDMKAILPEESVDAQYLLYALMARKGELVREIGTAAHGTRRLGTSSLEQFLIPLPPLSEQRAIARVLRTVQRAREATDAVIAVTRALKQSLMRHLFTYGSGAEPLPTRETPFGPVPAQWEIRPLSECAIVQTGATMGRKVGEVGSVTLPYLRVANVQDGYLNLSEIKHIRIRKSELGRYSLRAGDVLLTEGGDFDKLGRGFIWRGEIPSCVHQNHVFAVRTRRDLVSPEYLAYLTQSGYGKAYFLNVAHRTTNLASINSTKLKAFPVLVPGADEQERIVRAVSVVDGKLAAEASRRHSLDTMFNTLLHDLMTGKRRVHDLEGLGDAAG